MVTKGLSCFSNSEARRSHLQFLRIQPQSIKFTVGFIELLAEQGFEALLLFLEFTDSVDPAFQNSRTLAGIVDQISGALLIFLCFFADKSIKLRGHLFALLIIIGYKKAVNDKRLIVTIGAIECFKKIFEKINLVHMVARDEV